MQELTNEQKANKIEQRIVVSMEALSFLIAIIKILIALILMALITSQT